MEELKLIMTTIQGMGKDAQMLVLVYFGYRLLIFALGMGTLIFAIIVAVGLIRKAINDNSFGWQVAKMFGITHEIYASEKKKIIQWIAKSNPPSLQ